VAGYTVVEVDGVGKIEFPDTMSNDEIKTVLDEKYGSSSDSQPVLGNPQPQAAGGSEGETPEGAAHGITIPDMPAFEAAPPPSLMERMFPEGGRASAIMAGGMTGAEIGFNAFPSTPVGRVAGTTLGGVIGVGATAFGHSGGASLIGSDSEATMQENFAEMVTEAQYGAAGQILGPIAQATKQFWKESVKGVDNVASNYGDLARSVGIDVGIADAAKHGPAAGYRSVIGKFPLIGTPFVKNSQKQATQIANKVDYYLDMVAPHTTLSESGVLLDEAAKNSYKEARSVWKTLYESADALAAKASDEVAAAGGDPNIIDLTEVRQAGIDILNMRQRPNINPKGGGSPEALPLPKDDPLAAYLEGISQLADRTTVAGLREIQRDLSKLSGPMAKAGFDVKRIEQMRKATEIAANKMDLSGLEPEVAKEIAEAYGYANKTFSEMMKGFETPTAKQFIKVDKNAFGAGMVKPGTLNADELVPKVIQSKSPQALRDARKLVGDDAFNKAVRAHLDNAFEGAMTQTKTGISLDTDKLMKNMGLTAGTGKSPQILDEMLAATDLSKGEIRNFLKVVGQLDQVTLPSDFIARRAVFTGLGFLSLGTGFMDAPVSTVVLAALLRAGSHHLASPKVLQAANRVLVKDLSRSKRYTAYIRFNDALSDAYNEERGVPAPPEREVTQ